MYRPQTATRSNTRCKAKKEDRPRILHTYSFLWLGANPCNGARGNQREATMKVRRKNKLVEKVVRICVRFLRFVLVRLILRGIESLANGEL